MKDLTSASNLKVGDHVPSFGRVAYVNVVIDALQRHRGVEVRFQGSDEMMVFGAEERVVVE